MQEIRISKFKATCLEVLDRVATSGRPVLVTRFGRPIARIVPPPPVPRAGWFGAMKGTGRMNDDLIAPAADPAEWEGRQTRSTFCEPRRRASREAEAEADGTRERGERRSRRRVPE